LLAQKKCPRCGSSEDMVYMDDVDFYVCLVCVHRFTDHNQ
jgi:DNA-directed RNA polymerase subunit M/transcription elongation factor TFIIS